MDRDLPLVSVVIPCFNHGLYLPEAIQSVLACQRTDVEIVVVNDGSTDADTLEVLHNLPQAVVTHQEKLGTGAARNHGIGLARGKFIVSLDADNRITPALINAGLTALQSQADMGVAYGDALIFGEKEGYWKNKPIDYPSILVNNHIDNCSIFKKEMWAQVGGFDVVTRSSMEDWGFWLKCMAKGWRFAYLPLVTFHYRFLHSSNSRKFNRDPTWMANIYLHLLSHKLLALKYLTSTGVLDQSQTQPLQAKIYATTLTQVLKAGNWRTVWSTLKKAKTHHVNPVRVLWLVTTTWFRNRIVLAKNQSTIRKSLF